VSLHRLDSACVVAVTGSKGKSAANCPTKNLML
jgi:hypothetical protein